MAIIRSISLNKEHDNFLRENKDIKLSSVVQRTINEMMETYRGYNSQIQMLQRKTEVLQENLLQATEFIREQGLWEKFITTKEIKIR